MSSTPCHTGTYASNFIIFDFLVSVEQAPSKKLKMMEIHAYIPLWLAVEGPSYQWLLMSFKVHSPALACLVSMKRFENYPLYTLFISITRQNVKWCKFFYTNFNRLSAFATRVCIKPTMYLNFTAVGFICKSIVYQDPNPDRWEMYTCFTDPPTFLNWVVTCHGNSWLTTWFFIKSHQNVTKLNHQKLL